MIIPVPSVATATPTTDYRNLLAFNHSLLWAENHPMPNTTSVNNALEFGSIVDDYLTNGVISPNLTQHQAEVIRAVQRDSTWKLMHDDLDIRYQHTFLRLWKDGVWLKGLADVYCKGRYTADLKTTAAGTMDAFQKACKDYGYYHQAAWYMHLAKVQRHYIIAVSKKKPYKIFKVIVEAKDVQLELAEHFETMQKYMDTYMLWDDYKPKMGRMPCEL